MEFTNLNKDRKIRRKPSLDIASMALGKVPPQAKDLEEAILGAILLEKNAFDIVIEKLKPEYFYVEAHQRIYKAMQSLAVKSLPIDLLTVVEELKLKEDLDFVGGPYFVTKLTNAVVSSANIETHLHIVIQKFIQRELIKISSEIISDAYSDSSDVFDMLNEAEKKLFEITNNHLRKNFDDIETVLVKTIKHIEALRNHKDDISGVPTGFPKLDNVTNGWQPTDLIVLAARPGIGKTAFALNLALSAALHPTNPTGVGFFSLEMSSGQLVQRLLSIESEIHLGKISRGKLEDHEMAQLYKKGIERLSKASIFIDDSAALNIFELRAKCRRMKKTSNVGLIIIDYLQLMSGSAERNSNREQEISKISRDLKGLAKELQVPIIALSQLSREVEKRAGGNKIPQLSDLRESGAIEQDADMVMFLYRPEAHEIAENAFGESTKGEVWVRIAKHRNGSLENVKLKAMFEIQKFVQDDSDETRVTPTGGNWRKTNISNEGEATMYIEKGSKMNNGDYNEEDPF